VGVLIRADGNHKVFSTSKTLSEEAPGKGKKREAARDTNQSTPFGNGSLGCPGPEQEFASVR